VTIKRPHLEFGLMLPDGMTIEAEPGRQYGWLHHLALSVLTGPIFDSLQRGNYKGKYWPRVVLRRADGEQYLLFFEQHWNEALAKRDRLRREVESEPFEGWCDRYVVPASFMSDL